MYCAHRIKEFTEHVSFVRLLRLGLEQRATLIYPPGHNLNESVPKASLGYFACRTEKFEANASDHAGQGDLFQSLGEPDSTLF
jgi:hypothetical protein